MKRFLLIAFLTVALAACAGGGAPVETQVPAGTTQPYPAPQETGAPAVTEQPVMTEIPAGTETPVETEAPVETQAPVETEAPAAGTPIAFVGMDGNLWFQVGTEPAEQVTTDGTPPTADISKGAVQYIRLALSSDGRLLAFVRMAGEPQGDGLNTTFALQVFDRESGKTVQVAAEMPYGLDWRPGTHVLAHGLSVGMDYWLGRGQPNPDLARGIQFFDYDTGEQGELVAPAKGYHLGEPQWSPDGRYLGFDEIQYMEGRGNFAYYDFETGEYIQRGAALGLYDWSPDGSELVYDNMVYTPTGSESIIFSARSGENVRPLTPDDPDGAYTYSPVYSPDGNQVAYFSVPGGPDSTEYVLVVQPVNEGDPRELGTFEQTGYLAWMPDGQSVVFVSGPYEARQVLEVSVADGTMRVVGDGSEVAVP